MCLRFVFLLSTRVTTWLRPSWRDEAWKIAEILILRHQLAVLQRHQTRRPNLTWADRALLVALLGVIPKARRNGLRLLVTPDTILRWHRHHPPPLGRQVQHRPHRSLDAATPLKPLPEPVDLDQYRVRRQARVGGLINEYRQVG